MRVRERFTKKLVESIIKKIYKSETLSLNIKKMDTKIIGYILSVAGLGIIALSNQIIKLPILAASSKAMVYTIMAGVVLIAGGIALVMSEGSSSKIKQAAEEVPIYEGTGKNRKIVGYQKGNKK